MVLGNIPRKSTKNKNAVITKSLEELALMHILFKTSYACLLSCQIPGF